MKIRLLMINRQQEKYIKKRVEELESIRGLAALLVVFFHIPEWNTILDIGIINNGYLMVDLFFVLSGYVIYSSYSEKITSISDLFHFQFLRFGRLYPVHFIFLVVFIFFEIAKYIAHYKFGIISPNSQPFLENNPTAIFQQIFLVQSFTENYATFNGPAWSISVEFFTYLIFGISILIFKKKKDLFFSLLAIVSFVLLVTKTTFGLDILLRSLTGFSIGCITAFFIKGQKTNISKYVSLLIFVSIVIFLQLKTTELYDAAIYFLSAALIVSLMLSKDGYLNYILNSKVLIWLGSISYAIYMSHAAILWAINQAIRLIFKKPEIILISGSSTPQLNKAETLIALVFIILIVLSVSAFVYRFVEKPWREKSRRYISKIKLTQQN